VVSTALTIFNIDAIDRLRDYIRMGILLYIKIDNDSFMIDCSHVMQKIAVDNVIIYLIKEQVFA
jgi:hypothetical protein